MNFETCFYLMPTCVYKFRGVADFFGGGGDPYGGEDGIPMGKFRSQYRCYSVAMYGGNYREDVDNGGKSKCTYCFMPTVTHYIISYYAPICSGSTK